MHMRHYGHLCPTYKEVPPSESGTKTNMMSVDNRFAMQLVHTKLFMTKIWGHHTTTNPEEDEPEEID